jgi:exosortase
MFHKKKFFFIFTVVVCSGLGIYLNDTITLLVKSWLQTGPYGAWQFFIPPICFYMIWQKKHLLSEKKGPFDWIGIVLLSLSALSYLTGTFLLIDLLLEVSLVLFITGIIITILGLENFKSFAWPIGYLVMGTSVAGRTIDKTIAPLQFASAFMSDIILNLTGFTALRDGNYIRLPSIVLQVAEVCSGVNQLIALVAFAIPIAYIKLKRNSLRAILIIFTFFLTIFFNSLRIVLIGMWNYSKAQEHVHGPNDILLIPIILPVALLVLYFFAGFLQKHFDKSSLEKGAGGIGLNLFSYHYLNLFVKYTAIFICIPIFLNTLFSSTGIKNSMENNLTVHSLKTIDLENKIKVDYKYGNPDYICNKVYITNTNDTIFLHRAYYKHQNNQRRVLGNSIDMSNVASTQKEIDCKGINKMYVTESRLIEDKFRMPIVYWYTIGNSNIGSAHTMRTAFFSRKLKSRSCDGYFTVVGIKSDNANTDYCQVISAFAASESR